MNLRQQERDACIEAWLNCENLLITLNQSTIPFSSRTRQVIDECAHLCLGMNYAIQNNLQDINQLALLCMGICEECAEVCERYCNALMTDCASACRRCSSLLSTLASAAV